jgi:acyl-CoA synthetase (AMP-forming)/AMP-acid ligase II
VQVTDFLARHAAQRPRDDALVEARRRVTWAELEDRVTRLAHGLVDLGLRPGEFVGIQLPNRIEAVEAFLATQLAGLRPLTIMPIYRDRDVAHMLAKCRASALITVDEYRRHDHVAMAERLAPTLPSLRHTIVLGQPGAGMVSFEALAAGRSGSRERFAAMRLDPDAAARISFTSGTTDLPKGVLHSHNSDLVAPMLTAAATGLTARSPIFMPSPVTHVTGLLFGVYLALYTGAKLVLQDIWDGERALRTIAGEGVAFTAGAATFLKDLLDVYSNTQLDLSAFEVYISGGAPTAPILHEQARDWMGVTVLRSFGQSEAPLHALNRLDDPWEVLTSSDGRPFEGLRVKVADPEDTTRQLPTGETGEYATWGPHVFLGYVDDAERTAEARGEDGWYFSGDLCVIDEQGYVRYVDRSKDIINRGGVKISALEVEHALAAHPAVKAVAVVAMPDARMIERACAFVQLRVGHTLELSDLASFLKGRGVTTQKWPEHLEIVRELPITSTGKIQKRELRERARALAADVA